MAGDLEAHEVYEMNLARTDVVALSACDSGLGLISRGDEVWGFTRSFLVAGARTPIVSLWPVEDEATSRLMRGFYDQLRQGTPRDSLREAQLQLLRDSQTSHPFFWAAFNVVGDWR